MADLSVRIPLRSGEMVFKNPIMPAAACLGNLVEYKRFYELGILGAMMPNSIMYETGFVNKARKLYGAEYGYITSLGNNSLGIDEFVKKYAPHVPWQESPLILDLKAEDMEGLVRLSERAASAKEVAGIEINLNCPYSVTPTSPKQFWRDLQWVADMVSRVRAVCGNKLLVIKTPTTIADLEEIAAVAKEHGADAFTTFGALVGTAVDIEKREFRCGNVGSGGYCGPGVKPIALWNCQRVHKSVDIPIISAGGVTCADDVIEHIMAGAWLVQVGSANLTRPDFMKKLIEDLDARLNQLGVSNLEEIRGCAKAH